MEDGGLRMAKEKRGRRLTAILHFQFSIFAEPSGFDRFRLRPIPFGRLGDEAFFDGAGRDANVTHFAGGQEGFHALQVREEPALGDGGDVRANAALFLGLATRPDDAALHRSFAGEFTNSCHKNSIMSCEAYHRKPLWQALFPMDWLEVITRI